MKVFLFKLKWGMINLFWHFYMFIIAYIASEIITYRDMDQLTIAFVSWLAVGAGFFLGFTKHDPEARRLAMKKRFREYDKLNEIEKLKVNLSKLTDI